MNAICDYESNGRANELNFPIVNGYRNLIVAEVLKVLGFVNHQSRGVQKVQRDVSFWQMRTVISTQNAQKLKENGN